MYLLENRERVNYSHASSVKGLVNIQTKLYVLDSLPIGGQLQFDASGYRFTTYSMIRIKQLMCVPTQMSVEQQIYIHIFPIDFPAQL